MKNLNSTISNKNLGKKLNKEINSAGKYKLKIFKKKPNIKMKFWVILTFSKMTVTTT